MNASVDATNKETKDVQSVQSSTKLTQNQKIPKKPSKQVEFQQFLATLRTPGVKAHWQEVAQAIGVDPGTISDWLKLPEAIEAKKEGIRRNLEGMEINGVGDWKQNQARLRMLNFKTNEVNEGGTVTNNTLIVLADAVKEILTRS